MKNIEVTEVYTLFEEIKELVKTGNQNNTVIQPEIELPDLSAISELSRKLDEAIWEIHKPVKTEHHHIFSIASSKVFIGVIGLCIVCLFLLFTVFTLRKENATNKDNDLKYRYIQMQGEIIPTGVFNLDSIFENRRDSVRMIRKQVEQHEKTVIEKAKRLERVRLKEQEAERLKEEAGRVKQR
ncbi:MAG TPA: hypothetical protein DDZ96_12515 [Porphyromonadaceae bacterium]|jgi:hypothetical protein|nr:hypothetical protein [Porphyromonadaceae bacterium]HBX20639.1 hypothetical protein [Porphyromonadaceae bacterium]